MDVFEAIDSRISCRWFLDRPVDPNIVKELIARAQRAASGGNLQPWFVYALTGAPLAEFKRKARAAVTGKNPREFDTEYPIYPDKMWEPYYGDAVLAWPVTNVGPGGSVLCAHLRAAVKRRGLTTHVRDLRLDGFARWRGLRSELARRHGDGHTSPRSG